MIPNLGKKVSNNPRSGKMVLNPPKFGKEIPNLGKKSQIWERNSKFGNKILELGVKMTQNKVKWSQIWEKDPKFGISFFPKFGISFPNLGSFNFLGKNEIPNLGKKSQIWERSWATACKCSPNLLHHSFSTYLCRNDANVRISKIRGSHITATRFRKPF